MYTWESVFLSCGIKIEDDSNDDTCSGQHPHGETSRVQDAINIRGAGEVAGGEVERQGGLRSHLLYFGWNVQRLAFKSVNDK